MSMEQQFLDAWRASREQAAALGVRLRPIPQDAMNAARRALSGSRASEGFDRLAALNRLDLTLEALAVSSKFTALFSDAEANTALTRLLEAGYFA